MPWILILPERRRIKVEKGIKLKDILRQLDITDPDEVAIIVNGSLIEDPEYILDEKDNVRVIRQGIGG